MAQKRQSPQMLQGCKVRNGVLFDNLNKNEVGMVNLGVIDDESDVFNDRIDYFGTIGIEGKGNLFRVNAELL